MAYLSEEEVYDKLKSLLLPKTRFEAYGYPCRDPNNPDRMLAPLKVGRRLQLTDGFASHYTCFKCNSSYHVGADGIPVMSNGDCVHHPGRWWSQSVCWSCCKNSNRSARGCSTNKYHINEGETLLANYKDYIETRPRFDWEPNKHGVYALDCEMAHTNYGPELTRVTVVNYTKRVVYEKLVKPQNPILNYNTRYSGIAPGDLDCVTTTLADVQRDLLQMFSSKSILIGHSLHHDMMALKIYHEYFIDTQNVFPHYRGLPYKKSLETLMKDEFCEKIRAGGDGHDSQEDAVSALRLVYKKAKIRSI